jgi:hypothetical protein
VHRLILSRRITSTSASFLSGEYSWRCTHAKGNVGTPRNAHLDYVGHCMSEGKTCRVLLRNEQVHVAISVAQSCLTYPLKELSPSSMQSLSASLTSGRHFRRRSAILVTGPNQLHRIHKAMTISRFNVINWCHRTQRANRLF